MPTWINDDKIFVWCVHDCTFSLFSYLFYILFVKFSYLFVSFYRSKYNNDQYQSASYSNKYFYSQIRGIVDIDKQEIKWMCVDSALIQLSNMKFWFIFVVLVTWIYAVERRIRKNNKKCLNIPIDTRWLFQISNLSRIQ